jgi:hypothetical protein
MAVMAWPCRANRRRDDMDGRHILPGMGGRSIAAIRRNCAGRESDIDAHLAWVSLCPRPSRPFSGFSFLRANQHSVATGRCAGNSAILPIGHVHEWRRMGKAAGYASRRRSGARWVSDVRLAIECRRRGRAWAIRPRIQNTIRVFGFWDNAQRISCCDIPLDAPGSWRRGIDGSGVGNWPRVTPGPF